MSCHVMSRAGECRSHCQPRQQQTRRGGGSRFEQGGAGRQRAREQRGGKWFSEGTQAIPGVDDVIYRRVDGDPDEEVLSCAALKWSASTRIQGSLTPACFACFFFVPFQPSSRPKHKNQGRSDFRGCRRGCF